MIKEVEDASVIICAYTENRWDDLLTAVESVRQQTVQPREIIVVIDHNFALLEQARKHLTDVIVRENVEAKGLSGARNSGVAIAQGQIIAFLDDDAIAEMTWMEQLLEPYNNPNIVGVGGKIDPLWLGKCPFWFPEEFKWVVGCTYRGMPLVHTPVRNMIGANMSVRRDILTAIGGFREAFGCNHENSAKKSSLFSNKWLEHNAGDEETEFCIRVTQHYQNKLQFYYTPTARVRHRVPSQRTKWKYFLWRCYDEGVGKAFLASLHGTQYALLSERTYTFKTLPGGILHCVVNALYYRDVTECARAGTIIVGLLTTLLGYLVGCLAATCKHSVKHIDTKEAVRHTTRGVQRINL